MGIKERRDRERRELRQAILSAARAIAAEEGWQSVTVRKLANRIEYSPPVIYEHFENKEAVLQELVREGFRMLLGELQAARAAASNPEAALLAIATKYWEFAWAYPELYQVMHGLGGVPFCTSGPPQEAKDVFVVVSEALQEFTRSSGANINDPAAAVEIMWATLHGLVSLAMADRIAGDRERALALVVQAMQHLFAAWRAPAV